ncbi:TPA: hypothetical protein L4G57_002790 [Pseudomonas aeruginosa]|uniref:Uncharacterized protein n=1 Tax=Pseudomonas aeruginosa TaxID=287 RepID=A0A7M3ANX2_PSEAI|nr:hypothetical protein [Pseudomonas aeruginosa]EQL41743.1 hypothetical protein M770_08740 [Pseudomonas aeruginosa VRFPA03]KJC14735.1 hypothetical protein TN45_31370 [Pseudomonas aeruginosa]KSI73418.1 hypothetical protein AO992_21675 [Pseudomonas aeruginosa]KSK30708.1 hypothetical protein APA27_03025 [Pseudomonas aeruginosa]KSM50559.1 hypothetical protein APA74_32215 [Pseudomonas aeruginosa]
MKPKRLKLWVLTARIDFQSLVHGLRQQPFNDQNRVGVEAIEILDGKATFRYHEQRDITQSFTNPLGETVESRYSTFISFDIVFETLGPDRYSICMGSPPKDLKPFVELIRTATRTNFALEIVKPDISSIYQQLKADKRFTRVMAKRIVSGAVTFDIESSYRVDIASTGNAMTKLLEITGGRAAPIDKIKIVYTYDLRPVQIELSRSGSVAVSWDDDEHLNLLTSLLIR